MPRAKATKVVYMGPDSHGVRLPDGTYFPTGEPVVVPADVAASLLEQDTFERAESNGDRT